MITVLIATYNGEKTLGAVLDAYCQIDLPKDEWQLILVDNGSNDSTKCIIQKFNNQLPITYLFEPRRGKNAALNHGLSEVTGDLVVLSDDDALPCSDLLSQYRSASNELAGYSIFGGRVLPAWEEPPADWILSWVPLGPTFAILDEMRDDGPIAHYHIYGPNMAIRREVFGSGYQFDEQIGPKGKSYPQGSETQLLLKLRDDGYKAWHCSKAVVRHMIKSSQMSRDWILKRAIRYGRGQYRLGADKHIVGPIGGSVPLRPILRILKRYYLTMMAKIKNDEEQAFKTHWQLNYYLGHLYEAYNMHKRIC